MSSPGNYLGRYPVDEFHKIDSFTGNGVQTTFTLSRNPGSVTGLLVFITGVLQRATTDFTVSGTSLIFGSAPPNGGTITAWHAGLGRSQIIDQALYGAHGSCKLYLNGTDITLTTHNGNIIRVAGNNCALLSDKTLAISTLTVDTLYYIFAIQTDGVISSIEAHSASTYTHGPDTSVSNYGVEVRKTIAGGALDSTKTLVGMAYRPTSGTNLVRSWFNDPGYRAQAPLTANSDNITSTSFIEITIGSSTVTSLRLPFLIWTNETVTSTVLAATQRGTVAGTAYISIGYDGTTAEDTGGQTEESTGTVPKSLTAICYKTGLSEGRHDSRPLVAVSTNNMAFIGSATAGKRTTHQIYIPPR